MTRLCELAEKYGTDKVSTIRHDYTPFYDSILKDRKITRVLEIGIGTPVSMKSYVDGYQTGASLRMWREYFPEAEIWGLDNDPSALFSEPRIHTLLCDQSDVTSLTSTASVLLEQTMGQRFDLIIDDGSHQYEHQALTANTLIPRLLAKSGVYAIEDVIYRKELYARLTHPTAVSLFNLIGRTWDDCIFYVEGRNVVGL